MLLLALFGLLLLRLADRQLLALLFQLPPRFTRFEPYGRNPKEFKIVDLRLSIADGFSCGCSESSHSAVLTNDLLPQSQCVRKAHVG